jgi:nicotinate phosphoribosyltransferase
MQGARNAIIVGKEMAKKGQKLRGVRIDSGDLTLLSRKVRRMLDNDGLGYAKIMLSGDLNEHRIKEIVQKGGRADIFGVGTDLGTSRDAPALGGIYKLVEDNLGPRMKLSIGKVTLPGKKSVFRVLGTDGKFKKDLIMKQGEEPNLKDSYPLLIKVLEKGNIIYDPPLLSKIRERFLENLQRLPDKLKKIEEVHDYKVEISLSLKNIMKNIKAKVRNHY